MDSGSSAKQLFDGMPQLDDLPQGCYGECALSQRGWDPP